MRRHRLAHLLVAVVLVALVSGCFGRSGTVPGTYTASGFVRDSDGAGIDKVTLGFSGAFGTATTDSDGKWLKNGLRGTVTVTPAKTGHMFTPSNLEIPGPTSSANFTGSNDVAARGKLKVSFVGNTGSRVRSRVALTDLTLFDPSVYVPPFNSEAKGTLVGRYTPHSLIGSIGGMGVASPNYRLPLSLDPVVATGPHSGFSLFPIFDVVLARDIVYVDYLLEHGRYDFTVVEMTIGGKNSRPDSHNCFSTFSEVHVDLGDEYRDVCFPKEQRGKSHGTVHVFELVDLIPLGNQAQAILIRLSFDHAVDCPYILNPDGSYVRYFNPYFWDSRTSISLRGYVIYLPGLNLDLSSQSAHLILDWDLFDLIEVYDNGTPADVGDDLVTLRLDNPFPITLRAEPYGEWEPVVGDGVRPPDVSELDIRFYDLVTQQVFVRWINPSVADFRQVHVVRKEGTPPVWIEDGEVVYVGSGAMYQDDDVEADREYFYLVIVEDWDGLVSDGKTIGIRTDTWQFSHIQIYVEADSVPVGGGFWLRAYGYRTPDERLDALCRWELDGDVGGLSYDKSSFSSVLNEPGCTCFFKATKPGTGVITARKGDLSASVTIAVTE